MNKKKEIDRCVYGIKLKREVKVIKSSNDDH